MKNGIIAVLFLQFIEVWVIFALTLPMPKGRGFLVR